MTTRRKNAFAVVQKKLECSNLDPSDVKNALETMPKKPSRFETEN